RAGFRLLLLHVSHPPTSFPFAYAMPRPPVSPGRRATWANRNPAGGSVGSSPDGRPVLRPRLAWDLASDSYRALSWPSPPSSPRNVANRRARIGELPRSTKRRAMSHVTSTTNGGRMHFMPLDPPGRLIWAGSELGS